MPTIDKTYYPRFFNRLVLLFLGNQWYTLRTCIMPSKTPRQARAMRAAAAGKSTLGIPKSVGKEFVAADKRKKRRKKS